MTRKKHINRSVIVLVFAVGFLAFRSSSFSPVQFFLASLLPTGASTPSPAVADPAPFVMPKLPFDEPASSVVKVDYDSDGDTDVLASYQRLDLVSVLFNDGYGNFSETSLEGFSHPTQIRALDLNSDRQVDLAVLEPSISTIRVLLKGQQPQDIEVGTSPISFDFQDRNHDSYADVVVWTADAEEVYLNDGHGVFTRLEP